MHSILPQAVAISLILYVHVVYQQIHVFNVVLGKPCVHVFANP